MHESCRARLEDKLNNEASPELELLAEQPVQTPELTPKSRECAGIRCSYRTRNAPSHDGVRALITGAVDCPAPAAWPVLTPQTTQRPPGCHSPISTASASSCSGRGI